MVSNIYQQRSSVIHAPSLCSFILHVLTKKSEERVLLTIHTIQIQADNIYHYKHKITIEKYKQLTAKNTNKIKHLRKVRSFFCSQYNFKLQQQIYFLLEFVRGQWPVLNVDIPFELSGSTGAESAAVKAIYRWGEPYTWTLSY